MIAQHSREKLINAMTYFVTKTDYCNKTKLLKLLYFLDFRHYAETGLSVTGLTYQAWKHGPVPKSLWEEFNNPKQDMEESFWFNTIHLEDRNIFEIKAKNNFDDGYFNDREISLMDALVDEYKKTLAEDIVNDTHLENKPWHTVYKVQKKKSGEIPYELALRKHEKDEMAAIIKEREEYWGRWGKTMEEVRANTGDSGR